VLGSKSKGDMLRIRLYADWLLWSILAIGFYCDFAEGAAFLGRTPSGSNQNFPCCYDAPSVLPSNSYSKPAHSTNSRVVCALARQDNLVSGLAEISFAFSLGVLWSEFSIIQTGCGPLDFSDTLERICYQGVIASSGIAVFNRIVTRGSLKDTSEEFFGPLEDSTLWQVQAAEYSSALAVLGAFAALGVQTYIRGANMDGLSGIDVELCRAIRDL
jgi:hypothetical protein